MWRNLTKRVNLAGSCWDEGTAGSALWRTQTRSYLWLVVLRQRVCGQSLVANLDQELLLAS